jgi:hypothetical protein
VQALFSQALYDDFSASKFEIGFWFVDAVSFYEAGGVGAVKTI